MENEEIMDFLTSKNPEIRINPENFHPWMIKKGWPT